MIYIGIYYVIVTIIILNLIIRKKQMDKEVLGLLIIKLLIFPVYIPVIVIPILIVNSLYGNNSGVFSLIIAFLVMYIAIRLGTNIYNKIKIKLLKEEGIYIRDMEVQYSPAVLSYLQNQRIEGKKDLTASILNLCAKGFLQIEKKEEDEYELIPLKDKNSDELKKDEKYLYETISKKEEIDINKWIEFVKLEFDGQRFVKESKINLVKIFLVIYLVLLIGISIYQTNTNNNLNDEIFQKLAMTVFCTAFELALFEPIIKSITKYLRKGEYLDGTYSTKGAREMQRWNKYKKFLKDYTLLEDKPLESVTVLEKHIAYATVLNINKRYTSSFIEQLKVTHNTAWDFVEKNLLQE